MLSFIFVLMLMTPSSFSKEIYYEIPEGTSDYLMDWNSKEDPIIGEVGDHLIITNGDSVPHQLHTNGKPCKHGPVIPPGESWTCVLDFEYNSFEETNPIRSHFNYDLKFWVIVGPRTSEPLDESL